MRGLIAKDVYLCIKMNKKLLLAMYAFSIALAFLGKTSIYALCASAFLALIIGIHLVMTLTYDGLSHWKKYEIILPVTTFQVVGAKYILTFVCAFISIIATILIYGLHYLYSSAFSWEMLGISIYIAAIIPILWCSCCFPLAYWFGYMNIQYVRMIGLLLLIFIFNRRNSIMGTEIEAIIGNIINHPDTVILFIIVFSVMSYFISVAGYSKKK